MRGVPHYSLGASRIGHSAMSLLPRISLLICVGLFSLHGSSQDNEGISSGHLERQIDNLLARLKEAKDREAKAQADLLRAEKIRRAAQDANEREAEVVAGYAVERSNQAIGDAKEERSLLETEVASVCGNAQKQLQMDIEATKRQKKTVDAALADLDEWTKANQRAQWDALADGAKVVLGQFASYLERQANSARAFKGWLTRYEKQMIADGIPVGALEAKIESAGNGYLQAQMAADTGKMIHKGLDFEDEWERFTAGTSALAQSVAQRNAAVREVLKDPRIQSYLKQNQPDVDAAMFAAEDSLDLLVKRIVGNTVPVEFANFAVNYSIHGKEWWESRKQILDRYQLTDKELEAAAALKTQIKRTAEALKICKEHRVPLSIPLAAVRISPRSCTSTIMTKSWSMAESGPRRRTSSSASPT